MKELHIEEDSTTFDHKYATEYLVGYKWNDEKEQRNIFITRHTNHSGWVEDGQWVVCIWLGPMNPWYLSSDGMWRYKFGTRWVTAERAYQALRKSLSVTESIKKLEEKESDE